MGIDSLAPDPGRCCLVVERNSFPSRLQKNGMNSVLRSGLSWILNFRARTRNCFAAASSRRACEEREHGWVEGREVTRGGARPPVAVLDALAIDPVAAGFADVVLEGKITGQGPPAHQPRRDQFPQGVADGGQGRALF